MTQEQTIEFTEEETALAVAQEEAERLRAENAALRQRVVLLRAVLNRIQGEAQEEVQKKSPEKKASAPRTPATKRTQGGRR